MVEIQANAGNGIVAERAPANPPLRKAETPKSTERTVHDVVDISNGNQSIVNLARGQELAEDIRTKAVDVDFADELRKAMEDVRRIGRLFAETVRAAFKFFRF